MHVSFIFLKLSLELDTSTMTVCHSLMTSHLLSPHRYQFVQYSDNIKETVWTHLAFVLLLH